MFTLRFIDGGVPRAHRLREGDTTIGRAPTCDLVITAPLMSRHHAHVHVRGSRVYLKDAGSTYGTLLDGAAITNEIELKAGNTFVVANVAITLECDVAADDLLSEDHQLFDEPATVLRRIDDPTRPVVRAAALAGITPAPGVTPAQAVTPDPAAVRAAVERRRAEDRRKVDLGRAAGDRRTGRDRRGGRMVRLLTGIGKSLVTVQPIEQLLSRITDLVFEMVPADRTFLLLRDSIDRPLVARVMRNRDGTVPVKPTISRTIVNTVMRDRVAMLAKDALFDPRLEASGSIQAMNIRSFMCAPLWNQVEVIGVLYCDNPRTRKFTPEDLEVFTALSSYAAAAIEQARSSDRRGEDERRRERLQRQYGPSAANRIMAARTDDDAGLAFRDITVLLCRLADFHAQDGDVRAIGETLDTFVARMAEIVFEHDGTIDTVDGDGIRAVFGAPFDQPDHATRAVSAALAMRRDLAAMNDDRRGRPLRARMALDSGRALAGEIGPQGRRQFTVAGAIAATIANVESSATQPDQIVVTKRTRDRIGETFAIRPLGTVALRGAENALELFEVRE